MFDKKRNISGELPEHIEWIYATAIPKLEQMGVKVDVVRGTGDYVTEFYKVRGNRTKHPERIGKRQGFLLGGFCRLNSMGKVNPVRRYYRQFKEQGFDIVCYVGIAKDEPVRLARLKGSDISLLDIDNINGLTDSSAFFRDTSLKKASQAASSLQKHLQACTDVNTGKLDLSK